ncbi:MAG: SusC/RagA family TonB-linked outer membrane protein [Ferruginibacter sp.]|nr:SusC/RagA family TonB-linked outer membrane protein [Chitinophagaceae bacterium]
MKFTIALILLTSLQLSAKTYSQERITLNLQSSGLKAALKQIEKKSIFRFLYNDEVITSTHKVSINAVNTPVTEVLDNIFNATTLTYRILENNLVVISQKTLIPRDIAVSGKVTSATGDGLPSVTVKVKGSNLTTTTNAEGMFSISVPEGATLVFSSVGYTEIEVAVNGRTEVNITLQTSTLGLNEVVVIGYGSANKRDLTGSIVAVKAKEIADRPSSNPLSLLQGKVTGLSIVNSGRPGAEPDVRIRGTNTINGVKPVYIVDGILNDNINFLNPADIESIEVLKDPSSLAIFGVRGANGAIAVTTKKAKAGQMLVNFNSSVGIKKVQNRIDVTDGPKFKELYDEQLKNQSAGTFDYTFFNANTDWQEEIFQDAMLNYNNISITGATEKNRFYMGLGYINEEGLIKHERYRKYTLNFSDELRVTKGLKFGVTMNAYRAELPQERGVFPSIVSAPISPVSDPTTGLYHTLPSFQRAQVFNPLLSVESEKNTLISREFRAVGSIYGDVDFLRHFNFRVQLFADYGFNTSRSYSPIQVVYNPEIVGPNKRDTSRRGTSVTQSQDIYPKTQMDYLLTYKKKFGLHDISVLGGITTYYRGYEGVSSSVQQGTSQIIPNDPDKWYVDAVGDASTKLGSGSAWEDASLSYLARVLYNYDGKYLVNASFRRDGSSQFYRLGNQWKNFGAVGVGWVVSKEDFMDDQNFIDYLKLKGSWGILGNKNIDDRCQ